MMVVVNPSCHGGRGARRWSSVQAELLRVSPDAVCVVPADAAAARQAVLDAIDAGHDSIVAAGGDGTMNLVLDTLMQARAERPRAAEIGLGAIGLGSSNDFHKPFVDRRRLAGVPVRIDFSGARRADVGKAAVRLPGGGEVIRHFLLNASLGLVADGNQKFNEAGGVIGWLKPRNVDLAIALSAARVVAALRLPDVEVTAPDWRHRGAIANLAVLKSVHFAGGMRYDTGVEADDGCFDVNIWRAAGRLSVCRTVAGLYRGRFRASPLAVVRRATSIELRPSRPCALELDGEIVVAQSAQLEVLPMALKVGT